MEKIKYISIDVVREKRETLIKKRNDLLLSVGCMSSSQTQNLIRSTKFNINNCNSLKRLMAIAYTLC